MSRRRRADEATIARVDRVTAELAALLEELERELQHLHQALSRAGVD